MPRGPPAGRDALIERLASLPPVRARSTRSSSAFGTDLVAEVTGRSRRIVRKGEGSAARLLVESRAGSANLAETAAFMDDQKRILIFSDAGGTGRSYHADLGAKNQRLRVHYLLEPGWKADAAIQALAHQPHQPGAAAALPARRHRCEGRKAVPLHHRPPASTRSEPSRAASARPAGRGCSGPRTTSRAHMPGTLCASSIAASIAAIVAGCSLGAFEDATGLSLTDDNGLKDDLPPITTFLNRLLR